MFVIEFAAPYFSLPARRGLAARLRAPVLQPHNQFPPRRPFIHRVFSQWRAANETVAWLTDAETLSPRRPE
jgi:hypothetical protein